MRKTGLWGADKQVEGLPGEGAGARGLRPGSFSQEEQERSFVSTKRGQEGDHCSLPLIGGQFPDAAG